MRADASQRRYGDAHSTVDHLFISPGRGWFGGGKMYNSDTPEVPPLFDNFFVTLPSRRLAGRWGEWEAICSPGASMLAPRCGVSGERPPDRSAPDRSIA